MSKNGFQSAELVATVTDRKKLEIVIIIIIHSGQGGKKVVEGVQQVLNKLSGKEGATVLADQWHVILIVITGSDRAMFGRLSY